MLWVVPYALTADGLLSAMVNTIAHAFLDHDGILAFAHRGGDERWPENTMAAFQDAIDLGYRYIETDAYCTRDGFLLAFHDPVLDRVTNQSGQLAQLDHAMIRKARVGGTESIPLLEDVLGTWPDIRVNIDPKTDQAVAPLIQVIKRTNALDRICVGSFSGRRIKQIRSVFDARLCTSMAPWDVARLRFDRWGIPIGEFAASCAQVPMSYGGITIIDKSFVLAAKARRLQVHAWTINDPDDMTRLIKIGVHGIMTDKPRLLKAVLQEQGLWR